MREALMTVANEAYAEHFNGDERRPARTGFDGWLTAVRAFFFLIMGMLLLSLLTSL